MGPSRLGQVDDDEHPRLPRHADLGRYRSAASTSDALTRDQRALLRRHYLGFVFQGFNLLARTTALENVELPLLYRGEQPSARGARPRCSARTGRARPAGSSTPPAELSGGQQQRVAIARAHRHRSRRCCSPTSRPATSTPHDSLEIMELLADLNRTRASPIMMVTHEADMAALRARTHRPFPRRPGRERRAADAAAGVPRLMHVRRHAPARAARDPPQPAALVPDHARHRHRRRRGGHHGDARQRRDRAGHEQTSPASARNMLSVMPGQGFGRGGARGSATPFRRQDVDAHRARDVPRSRAVAPGVERSASA